MVFLPSWIHESLRGGPAQTPKNSFVGGVDRRGSRNHISEALIVVVEPFLSHIFSDRKKKKDGASALIKSSVPRTIQQRIEFS